MNAVERLIDKLRRAANPDDDWSCLEDADLEHAAAEIERLQAALRETREYVNTFRPGAALKVIDAALSEKGKS